MKGKSLSCIRLLATPWTAACQTPLSIRFSRQEYWSGVPLPSRNLLQYSSVTQSCPTLCDPMNHSSPGLPVHHQLPEFTQTHVYRVSDAIQPSQNRCSLNVIHFPVPTHGGNLILSITFLIIGLIPPTVTDCCGSLLRYFICDSGP